MNKLTDWLYSVLTINGETDSELLAECPKCGHERFYFNKDKLLGYCHRASCHWAPNLKELGIQVGSTPGEFVPSKPRAPRVLAPIDLPDSEPLIRCVNGQFTTCDYSALEYVEKRGVPSRLIHTFGLRANKDWIIAPVYNEEAELVSYVARNRDPYSTFRYQYPAGGRHKDTFLGWKECSLWKELILVENTFVSLWLRGNGLPCTTNFGSSLSQAQIDLIKRSRVTNVVLLWDEGAEVAANKAVTKLRAAGIMASFRWLKGQPDNYTLDQIKEMVQLWKPATPVSTS